jgi:hypothetical protein
MNLDNLGSDGFLQKKSKNSQNNVEGIVKYHLRRPSRIY